MLIHEEKNPRYIINTVMHAALSASPALAGPEGARNFRVVENVRQIDTFFRQHGMDGIKTVVGSENRSAGKGEVTTAQALLLHQTAGDNVAVFVELRPNEVAAAVAG